MTNSRIIDSPKTSSRRGVFASLRALSGSRLGLLAMAGVAIIAGLAFNWSWLVAAGVAPLLVSTLPCVAMCALGLCMTRMSGNRATAAPGRDSPSSNHNEAANAPVPDREI